MEGGGTDRIVCQYPHPAVLLNSTQSFFDVYKMNIICKERLFSARGKFLLLPNNVYPHEECILAEILIIVSRRLLPQKTSDILSFAKSIPYLLTH